MKGYKGFSPDLKCCGKQYAENTVFEEECAEICEKGMHFCKNPIDVLDYYPLTDRHFSINSFAKVEALADVKTRRGNCCTTKLKVNTKMSFDEFIDECVKRSPITRVETINENCTENVVNRGDLSVIANRAEGVKIINSGWWVRVLNAGFRTQIGSSGGGTQIENAGDCAQIVCSGPTAYITGSGEDATIICNGDQSHIAYSGGSSHIFSSGENTKIVSSGNNTVIACAGAGSVVCCSGNNSTVKAKRGCWITLSEWGTDFLGDTYAPIRVKTEFVDGDKIKEDVFYKLVNGEFVEVNPGHE